MKSLISALMLTLICACGTATAQAPSTEWINAASILVGARYHHEGSDYGLADGSNGAWGDGTGGQAGDSYSLYEEFPVRRVLELPETFDLSRVEIINIDEPEAVKTLRLESGPGLDGPWQLMRELSLKQGEQMQGFDLAPATAVRWVRISLIDNYGDDGAIGLNELRLLGTRSAPRKDINFTGHYGTDEGGIKLVQDGQRVTGCFDAGHGGASIEGTVEGAVMSGFYTLDGESTHLLLVLTPEGELRGVHGSTADHVSLSRFDGSTINPAEYNFSCKKPENQIAEALQASGRVSLRGILFDTAKDVIRGESLPVLQALADAMAASPNINYLIEGHTDDRGGADYNLRLSDHRAAAVKRWLVEHDIDEARLQTQGFGLTRPALPNDSEAGRAANRRVEVAVR